MCISPVEVLHRKTQFNVHITTDTAGNVDWRLDAVHVASESNDADCKYLISVIEKLNKFTAELESLSRAEA